MLFIYVFLIYLFFSYEAVFPLTDSELQKQTFDIITARALWSVDQFKTETLPAIKDYFGEEIGFYFGKNKKKFFQNFLL